MKSRLKRASCKWVAHGTNEMACDHSRMHSCILLFTFLTENVKDLYYKNVYANNTNRVQAYSASSQQLGSICMLSSCLSGIFLNIY